METEVVEVMVNPVPNDGEFWIAGSLVTINGRIFRIVAISENRTVLSLEAV